MAESDWSAAASDDGDAASDSSTRNTAASAVTPIGVHSDRADVAAGTELLVPASESVPVSLTPRPSELASLDPGALVSRLLTWVHSASAASGSQSGPAFDPSIVDGVLHELMKGLYPLRYRWAREHCIQESEHILVNYYFHNSLDISLLAYRHAYPNCSLTCKGCVDKLCDLEVALTWYDGVWSPVYDRVGQIPHLWVGVMWCDVM